MKVVLEQTFPMGRFHATPWKVFPYDDPHGEWPPSPWRLLRAVLSRSYQFERESGEVEDSDRELLVRAFATSRIAWRVPDSTWRGPSLRQYQPADFKWSNTDPQKIKAAPIPSQLRSRFSGDIIAIILPPKGQKLPFTQLETFTTEGISVETYEETENDTIKSIRQAINDLGKSAVFIKRYPPGIRSYNTTKVQDNFWLTAGEDQPLYWIFEGSDWSDASVSLLDQCLGRMTYFGRAESITVIGRLTSASLPGEPNCVLSETRTGDASPVLCLRPEATLEQLCLTTDDDVVRKTTVPPGAVWRFAQRPARPAIRVPRSPVEPVYQPQCVLQFALGSRVAPSLAHTALIANWFRGRAVRFFLETHDRDHGDWHLAPDSLREAVSLLAGKGADGKPLSGHRHAHFGLYIDPSTRKPTRLIAWRSSPFTEVEEAAIRRAAAIPFSLGHREKSAKGQKATKRDPWKVQCVPLDSAVPLPPGFDSNRSFHTWESLTPYVPPRHAFGRQGKPRAGKTPQEQLMQDLERRGLSPFRIALLDRLNQPLEDQSKFQGEWVKVHPPGGASDGATNLSKLGFRFRLTFPEPLPGPLALGHSSHFGLGLFLPAD